MRHLKKFNIYGMVSLSFMRNLMYLFYLTAEQWLEAITTLQRNPNSPTHAKALAIILTKAERFEQLVSEGKQNWLCGCEFPREEYTLIRRMYVNTESS